VRLIDIPAALSARSYTGDGEIAVEVTDGFLPENAGRYRVTAGGAERTEDAADLSLDITGLGSVYLGGFGFGDLVRASRAQELTDDAAARGDALFGTGVEPWCAEIF
jgi:predicted acetyltransferase